MGSLSVLYLPAGSSFEDRGKGDCPLDRTRTTSTGKVERSLDSMISTITVVRETFLLMMNTAL